MKLNKLILIIFVLIFTVSLVSAELTSQKYKLSISGFDEIDGVYKEQDEIKINAIFEFNDDDILFNLGSSSQELKDFFNSIELRSTATTVSQIPHSWNGYHFDPDTDCSIIAGTNNLECTISNQLNNRPEEMIISLYGTAGLIIESKGVLDNHIPILEISDMDEITKINLTIDDLFEGTCSGLKNITFSAYNINLDFTNSKCNENIIFDIKDYIDSSNLQGEFSFDTDIIVSDVFGNSITEHISKFIDFCEICVKNNLVYSKTKLDFINIQTKPEIVNLCVNTSAFSGIKAVYYNAQDTKLEAENKGVNIYCTHEVNFLQTASLSFSIVSNDPNIATLEYNADYSIDFARAGPVITSIDIGQVITETIAQSELSPTNQPDTFPEKNIFFEGLSYYSSNFPNTIKVKIDWDVSKLDINSIGIKPSEGITFTKDECIEVYISPNNKSGYFECYFDVNLPQNLPESFAVMIDENTKNKENIKLNDQSIRKIYTLDNNQPELIKYEQKDKNKNNRYISQYSQFILETLISDIDVGLSPNSIYVDFSNLTIDPLNPVLVNGNCDTSINPYKCNFEFQSEVESGYYNVTLHAYDKLNNKKSFPIEITVFEYVNETDWFYYDIDKMVPQAFDRAKLHKSSPSIFLFGSIKSTRPDGEIIETEIGSPENSRCWANINNLDLYKFIDEPKIKLLDEDEFGNKRFQLTVRAKTTKEPTPDTITIMCPIRIRGVSGTQVISDTQSEYDKLTFTISFVNKRSAKFSETVADKIIAAGNNKFITNKWIGKFSSMLNKFEKICKIAQIGQKVYDTLTKLRAAVYIVAKALDLVGVGEPLWIGFNKGIEAVRCSLSGVQPSQQGGIFGFFRKACTHLNCNGKSNLATKAFDKINKNIYDSSKSITSSVSNVVSKIEKSDKNIIQSELVPTQTDASNSLIGAIGSFCIPDIIKGLERKRVIECNYINCLWDVGLLGGNMAQCDAFKSYANCKYVMGEITGLLPSLNLFDNLKNNVMRRLKEIPERFLQDKLGGLLGQFQICDQVLSVSGYTTGSNNQFAKCLGGKPAPSLKNGPKVHQLILCGVLESKLQGKDLKEIFLPVDEIKDSFKSVDDNPDLEKFCQNATTYINEAKDIKAYINDNFKATQSVSIASDNAAEDQEFKLNLFQQTSQPLTEVNNESPTSSSSGENSGGIVSEN